MKAVSLAIGAAAFVATGLVIVAQQNPPERNPEMGSIARDAPSMQVITSPEVKHTEQDTEEWVPAVGLEQISRTYAKIIDEMNKLDRKDLLPVRGAATSGAGQ